jgi:CubicO group peptidase (beta-lactamase class C family)
MRTSFSLVLVIFAAAILHAGGDPSPSSLPRSTPEAQGVSSSAILAFVQAADREVAALHSLVIVRHGHVIAEGWWAPYTAREPHMLFSLSKSFTSTAVGFAAAEGLLSVDDLVLGFFPDEAPADPSAHLRAMRVRDLLTMTTGHHDEDLAKFPFGGEENLVQRFLALPVAHKPGTLFVYNTPASYMLSAIVQKVTGQTVLDYLRPRLFEPLGISDPAWDASAQGVTMGGFGLSVRTEDIARFGLLYLQKGRWQGRQLLPAAWVDEATARQVSNGSSPSSDWEQGYGYQFWRSRHGFYRGDGAHGQFCLVLPQHDTVIAITAGTRDMGAVMNLAWDRLVPALRPGTLPPDPAGHAALTARLSSLALPAQAATATAPRVAALAGRQFVFGTDARALQALAIDRLDPAGVATLTFRIDGTDHQLSASPGTWQSSTMPAPENGKPEPVAASGAWTAPDTYTLQVVRSRTPFVMTFRLRFAGDQLTIDAEQNVGGGDRRMQWIGRARRAPVATTD